MLDFFIQNKSVIEKFLISIIAGSIFYFLFTWLPNYRKKRKLKIFKNMLWAKLEFRLNYMVQEMFFYTEDTDDKHRNFAIYLFMSNDKTIKKLFKKHGINSNNFDLFVKELNSPISVQEKYSDLIKLIRDYSESHTFSKKSFYKKKSYLSKDYFLEIIKDIKTDTNLLRITSNMQKVTVSQFMTREKNQILDICDKLFQYNDIMPVEESKLLSEIYNHKYLNKWNGVEPHQYFRFSSHLKSYLDECYTLFLIAHKLTWYVVKNMTNKEYNNFINSRYDV